MTSHDFSKIQYDYAFFMAHCTEAERGLAAYGRDVAAWRAPKGAIRMLDFGCGQGEFTERFLTLMNWPPASLELTLCEPVQQHLEQAAHRLRPLTRRSPARLERLAGGGAAPFDLIMCNHVLYFVDDLDRALRQLLASLAPGGLLLLAMADWENALLQLWKAGFAKLNRPVPYYAAEDLADRLSRVAPKHERRTIDYEIRFSDSRENRGKILRFLFGPFLAEIGPEALLDEFDRYVVGDQVVAATSYEHFVVRGS